MSTFLNICRRVSQKLPFGRRLPIKNPLPQNKKITLARRAKISSSVIKGINGKLKLPKTYEVYDSSKNKWGGLPKVTEGTSFPIRVKTTAKSGASDTGNAASVRGTIKIEWGEVSKANNSKEGIPSAKITGKYPGGMDFAKYGFLEEEPIWVCQSNIKQFNKYANTAEGLSKHYILIEDIRAEIISENKNIYGEYDTWIPIGGVEAPFTGSLNGNDYTISGIMIGKETDAALGLFSYIGKGGRVSRIRLGGGVIEAVSNYTLGGVCAINYGIVEKCYSGTISVMGDTSFSGYVGGICAVNHGEIKEYRGSADGAQISGTGYVGNIAGCNNGLIENCYRLGSTSHALSKMKEVEAVYGSGNVGMLAGTNTGTINKCYIIGGVEDMGNLAGSCDGVIAGSNSGVIKNCFAYGDIYLCQNCENFSVGRICGRNQGGTLENNYSVDDVFFYIALNESAVSDTDPAGFNGADIPKSVFTTKVWWETTLGFDFGTVWRWNNTAKLPELWLG